MNLKSSPSPSPKLSHIPNTPENMHNTSSSYSYMSQYSSPSQHTNSQHYPILPNDNLGKSNTVNVSFPAINSYPYDSPSNSTFSPTISDTREQFSSTTSGYSSRTSGSEDDYVDVCGLGDGISSSSYDSSSITSDCDGALDLRSDISKHRSRDLHSALNVQNVELITYPNIPNKALFDHNFLNSQLPKIPVRNCALNNFSGEMEQHSYPQIPFLPMGFPSPIHPPYPVSLPPMYNQHQHLIDNKPFLNEYMKYSNMPSITNPQ